LEPNLRWYLYLGAFTALAVWEILCPQKRLVASTAWRWGGNVALMAATQFLLIWLLPIGSVITALAAREANWGLLNQSSIPVAGQVMITILALDFTRYLQHWLFHAVPALWRIHRIHHSDVDMDLTTGLRHHPLEAVVSAATHFPVVWLLGSPPVAVAGYGLFQVFHAVFSYAKVATPLRLDAVFRWFIVTPDMHRVHHSDLPEESQRNYGLTVPFWDRLLKTYQAQPNDGHEAMGSESKAFKMVVR
jgi:sterol desaturase/sphingolipid hydroxylase (fatty acid hydroxylase superfamily)